MASLRRPSVVRTNASCSPPGDQAGMRSGAVVVIGCGSRSQRRLRGERDRLDVGVAGGRLVQRDVLVTAPGGGVAHRGVGAPKSARSCPLSRSPTIVVPALSRAPVLASDADPGDIDVGEGFESMAACVPSSNWPAGGGGKPSREPGGAGDRVVAADRLELQDAAGRAVRRHAPRNSARGAVRERRSRGRPVTRRERRDDAGLAVEHEQRPLGRRHDVAVELGQELHPLEQHVSAVARQRGVELVGGGVDARGNREPGAGARVQRARSRSPCRSRSGRRRRSAPRRARSPAARPPARAPHRPPASPVAVDSAFSTSMPLSPIARFPFRRTEQRVLWVKARASCRGRRVQGLIVRGSRQ